MSTEDTLIQVRQSKHQEANGGTYPLAAVDTQQISNILSSFNDNNIPVSLDLDDLNRQVVTCGRVSAIRKSGSITFIKIVDSTGSIQLIATKSAFESLNQDYNKLKLIDLGDIIEVCGRMCLSKTNENSLLIIGWSLLTKAHKPPPEKFSGLTDTETKYRKRYLDLLSSEESRALFTVRSYTLRAIRSYLEDNGFLEVETSTLNTVNSGANAKPFTTHHNGLDINLFLRIAPELYLKRLIVGGLDKVFEIGRNYRNEGLSTRHNPEFTMMELYQAYGRFSDLLSTATNLFQYVDNYLDNNLPINVSKIYQTWKSARSFTFDSFSIVTMWDAVNNAAEHAGVRVNNCIYNHKSCTNTCDDFKILEPNNSRLSEIDLDSLRENLRASTSNGEKIALLFEYLAEPFLTLDYRTDDGNYSKPVIITEYPKAISPLARAMDSNSNFCDRFELFVEGRELANAFQELNDPEEQALRFQEQLRSNQKDAMDYDADYVDALRYGMPPAIGLGLGVDRLVMLLTNAASIKDVILFPTMKPIC